MLSSPSCSATTMPSLEALITSCSSLSLIMRRFPRLCRLHSKTSGRAVYLRHNARLIDLVVAFSEFCMKGPILPAWVYGKAEKVARHAERLLKAAGHEA